MYDPSKPDAWMHIPCLTGQTHQQAIEAQRRFLQGKTIARPKATSSFTVEQLENMSMAGVYSSDI